MYDFLWLFRATIEQRKSVCNLCSLLTANTSTEFSRTIWYAVCWLRSVCINRKVIGKVSRNYFAK